MEQACRVVLDLVTTIVLLFVILIILVIKSSARTQGFPLLSVPSSNCKAPWMEGSIPTWQSQPELCSFLA